MGDRRLRSEIDREFQAHLELATLHNRQRGLPEGEARVVARQRFGDRVRLREEVLAEHSNHVDRIFSASIRVASLAIPFAVLIASVTLILGLQFRLPMTFHVPGTWVSIWQQDNTSTDQHTSLSSYEEYRVLSDRRDVFSAVTAARYETQVVSGAFPSRKARIKRVTPGYLAAIGAQPVWGSDVPVYHGDERAVLLTHQSWSDWFGNAAHVLGDTISVGGVVHRIVGIVPADVEFFYPTDLLAPLSPTEETTATNRRLLLAGQLAPGMSVPNANEALAIGTSAPALLIPSTRSFGLPFRGTAVFLALVAAVLAIWGMSTSIGRVPLLASTAWLGNTNLYRFRELTLGLILACLAAPKLIALSAVAITGDTASVFDFSLSLAGILISLGIVTAGHLTLVYGLRRRTKLKSHKLMHRHAVAVVLQVGIAGLTTAYTLTIAVESLRSRPETHDGSDDLLVTMRTFMEPGFLGPFAVSDPVKSETRRSDAIIVLMGCISAAQLLLVALAVRRWGRSVVVQRDRDYALLQLLGASAAHVGLTASSDVLKPLAAGGFIAAICVLSTAWMTHPEWIVTLSYCFAATALVVLVSVAPVLMRLFKADESTLISLFAQGDESALTVSER